MTDLDRLTIAGEMMFGDDWRHGMARALGPYHPGGRRPAIDSRMVRRWADGSQDIEPWAIEALPKVLRDAADKRERDAADLLQDAVALREIAYHLYQRDDAATQPVEPAKERAV